MELLKQRAQLQRRAFAAVRHDRHRDVVGAVDLPTRDEHRDARNALQPALALVAAFALARDQLPVSAGACSRIVLLGDEAAAVERDDVECSIALTSFESAAHVERATIASVLAVYARVRNAGPVLVRRLARSVASSLIGRA